ncbi:MAG: cupin domain-containing protein [Chloroflexi bacterium]|nr:cupin domain-containing protein [Chloroflexota bacterium]
MAFTTRQAKGLTRCLVETGIDPEKLRIHISEIPPGTRAHPPHTHEAVEAFYVLEGHGAVEVGGERHAVGPNEAIILDARNPHGLENIGDTPMRYLVIITPA